MAIEIKTRFGTLNLGSGSGGGVPLALGTRTKGEIPSSVDVQKDATIITNLNPTEEKDNEGKITQLNLNPIAVSLVDIVKPLTNTDTPIVNTIKLNTNNKLELHSLNTSRLEQDGWLILDSEKAELTTTFENTDNYSGGNK